MDANDYQEFTRKTAIYPPTEALSYLTLGLTSEAGEVAGKAKKFIRDGTFDQNAFLDEVGDVLWYCARLADTYDVPLSELFARNRDKLQDRLNRHVLQGSGDTR